MSPEESIRKMLNETYMPTNKPPRDPHILIHVPDPKPRDPHVLIHVPDPPPRDPELIHMPEDKPILKPKPNKLGENVEMNRLQIIKESISLLIEKGVKGLAREFNAISKGVRRAEYTAGTLGATNNNSKIWVKNPTLAQTALDNVDAAKDKSAVLAAKASYKLQRSQDRFNRRILQDPSEQQGENIAMLGRIRASRENRAASRGETPPPRLKMKDIKTISQLAQRHKDLLTGTVRMSAAYAGLDSDQEGIIRLNPRSYDGKYARGDLHPLTGTEYPNPNRVARTAHIISGEMDKRVPQIPAPRRTAGEVDDHFKNVEAENARIKEFMAGPNRTTSNINAPVAWGRTPVGQTPPAPPRLPNPNNPKELEAYRGQVERAKPSAMEAEGRRRLGY